MNIEIIKEYKKELDFQKLKYIEDINKIINNADFTELYLQWINQLSDWEKNKLLVTYDLIDDINKNNFLKDSLLYKNIENSLEFGRINILQRTFSDDDNAEFIKLKIIKNEVLNNLNRISETYDKTSEQSYNLSESIGNWGNNFGLKTTFMGIPLLFIPSAAGNILGLGSSTLGIITSAFSKSHYNDFSKDAEMLIQINNCIQEITTNMLSFVTGLKSYPNKEKYKNFDETLAQFKYLNRMYDAIENLISIVENFEKKYKKINVENFIKELKLVKSIIEKEKRWLYNYCDSFIPKYAGY
ncbi:hypothetical protein [Mycoplasma seminis]|uniref:Uncharacterized protein n=1 Tax=Mycoplasma seminis TaxID=512749 RepID=A0ABY9H9Z5_9MOLU|nr:hypothetical protein [Mycoplasma seminis]WLP85399.1 hypothetical protein Q8852_03700 [Mycoplasma seminis]